MAQAKHGDKVKVHYTGKLNDGTVFDSSKKRDPLEFIIGDKKVIVGFEQGVLGMEPGETKTVKINSKDAYGDSREDMIIKISKTHLPKNIEPKVGQNLQIKQEDGQIIVVTITKLDDETITVDANHPLAGKDLTFEIELVEIA
ncbi:peptidylprolyl isomerase [Candidatus Dependentiae bacterium]